MISGVKSDRSADWGGAVEVSVDVEFGGDICFDDDVGFWYRKAQSGSPLWVYSDGYGIVDIWSFAKEDQFLSSRWKGKKSWGGAEFFLSPEDIADRSGRDVDPLEGNFWL